MSLGDISLGKIDESWYKRIEGVPEGLTAGGVVIRNDGEQVLVALAREKEHSEFVLPKGHVEPGEDVEAAARREIEEEVGLSDLELVHFLGVKERLDFQKREWKITSYFLFTTRQTSGAPTDRDHHSSMHWYSLDCLPEFFWPEQKELVEENRETILSVFS